jgi:S-(hydroxymethyl)glutathione dehydrogenase/alcohol dehydrogenase
MAKLLGMIERGELDPSLIVTHTMSLADAPRAYDMFAKREEGCVKVVLKP